MAQGVQISKDIGERVRKLRKARKWSLKDLATLVDISWTYLGALERGEKRWIDERIEQVAETFSISPGLLMDSSVDIEKVAQISRILEGVQYLSDEQALVIEQMISTLASARRAAEKDGLIEE